MNIERKGHGNPVGRTGVVGNHCQTNHYGWLVAVLFLFSGLWVNFYCLMVNSSCSEAAVVLVYAVVSPALV